MRLTTNEGSSKSLDSIHVAERA